MKYIKWFFAQFEPNEFKENSYGWLMNQFSHVVLGLLTAYFLAFFMNPLYALIVWLGWELRHTIISKNIKDSLLDLLFIYQGIGLYFLLENKYLPLFIILTITILLFTHKKIYYK
jgi:hypothetical protein